MKIKLIFFLFSLLLVNVILSVPVYSGKCCSKELEKDEETTYINRNVSLYHKKQGKSNNYYQKSTLSNNTIYDDEEDLINNTIYDDKLRYDEEDDVYFTPIEKSKEEIEIQEYETPILKYSNDKRSTFFKIGGHVNWNERCMEGWKTNYKFKKFVEALVSDNGLHPWNAVGCLMVQNSKRRIFGSAVQIEEGYILTAAHNVYKKMKDDDGETIELFAESVTFYPLLDEENAPKVTLHGEAVALYTNFCDFNISDENKMLIDFALIKLKEKGYSAFLPVEDNKVKNGDDVLIIGYPGIPPCLGRNMICQNTKVNSIINGIIHYMEGHQYQGQSGGAICVQMTDYYQLIGIHTHILKNKRSGGGVFFNQENLEKIKTWHQFLENCS